MTLFTIYLNDNGLTQTVYAVGVNLIFYLAVLVGLLDKKVSYQTLLKKTAAAIFFGILFYAILLPSSSAVLKPVFADDLASELLNTFPSFLGNTVLYIVLMVPLPIAVSVAVKAFRSRVS